MDTRRSGAYLGWFLVGVLALGVPLGAAWAVTQQPEPSAGPGEGRLLKPEDRAAIGSIYWQRLQERVGLTDQQVAEIRSTLEAQREAMRQDARELRAARLRMRQLLTAPTADPAAVQGVTDEVKALQARMLDRRVQNQLAIRAKLTPEQFGKWMELREGMAKRGHGRGPVRGMM
jgi:Spy/CpxP family protein refolding chaperone